MIFSAVMFFWSATFFAAMVVQMTRNASEFVFVDLLISFLCAVVAAHNLPAAKPKDGGDRT